MKEKEVQENIGKKIQYFRDKTGISLSQLSLQIDMNKASLSRIETGKGNPTIRTLLRISNALKIDMKELLS
jgi:transcriptional regulator with XRE-family HTH domain